MTAQTETSLTEFIDAQSKRQPGDHALAFAELLSAKFAGKYAYTVMGGNKFDRIVSRCIQFHPTNGQRMCFAFVDKAGNVYKAAGWPAPAKGIRYDNIFVAAGQADPHGGFLYMGRNA